jgi:hypothetical protein
MRSGPTHIDGPNLQYAGWQQTGEKGICKNPLKYFAELRDPRVELNREHLLEEVQLIAIAAVLSRAESWNIRVS